MHSAADFYKIMTVICAGASVTFCLTSAETATTVLFGAATVACWFLHLVHLADEAGGES